MATPAQVRSLITAQPFRHFTVHLASGRSVEIRHPENIACDPGGREAVIFADGEMHLVDMIHIDLIARVPTADTQSQAEGNGA